MLIFFLDLDASSGGWDLLFQYRECIRDYLNKIEVGSDLGCYADGRPSGIYGADEVGMCNCSYLVIKPFPKYLAGMEAVRGTELCLVVARTFFTHCRMQTHRGLA